MANLRVTKQIEHRFISGGGSEDIEFMRIDFFRDNGDQHHVSVPLPINDVTLILMLKNLTNYVENKIKNAAPANG